MDKRAGPVAEISLERGEISLTGMGISPYKHSQAGWPGAGMKVQRYRRKLFLTVKSMSKQQNCPGKRGVGVKRGNGTERTGGTGKAETE